MTDNPRVQYGEPPLTWLWDLYPLADGAWGNVLGFNDNSGDGYTIDMRLWLRPGQMSNYPPPAYRPAHASLPPVGYADGGTRRCYVPQPEDLARVKSIFPNLPDPANPSWPQVEAELIAADRSPDELRRMTAPALIRLLAKSHDLADPSATPTPAVIADRIESLIAEADDWMQPRPGIIFLDRPEPESRRRERERVEQVRQNIATNGKAIVSALVKCGQSAAPLLSLLNWINDGDTVAARKDWPTVKVALQETAIRLRLRGPEGDDASTPSQTAIEAPSSMADLDYLAEDDEQQAPALTKGERMTLAALATFDPSRLASALDVAEAMPATERRSERTTRLAINKLVELDLAERPEGEKQGARLTIRGRGLATKIAD